MPKLEGSHETMRRKTRIAGVIVVLAVLSDQLTKLWAQSCLEEGTSLPLVGEFLTLQLVRNSGAAFSVGSSTTWIFTVFSIVILAVLGYALVKVRTWQSIAAVGLLAGGAIGNLIDRLVQPPSVGSGHVIDFINYNGWFVGNVADIWIVVAAVWLALALSSEFADAKDKTIVETTAPQDPLIEGGESVDE